MQLVTKLEQQAKAQPRDAAVREQLGNVYFDAERFEDAIRWYEASLAIDTRNVNVSTDLAVSYYYSRQPDRALQQIERSLAIEPTHAKTLLNQGIIRALGKQDLAGAFESWSRVVAVAPNTPEAGRAQQLLDEQAQKVRESLHNALIGWAQSMGEGSDYTDNLPRQCLHPVGHWYEIPNLLLNGVLREMLAARPSLRTLMVHNIDTLGANVDPAVLGAHLASGAALTAEVITRRIEDRGGCLAAGLFTMIWVI